jgi:hypothetical protein
MPAQYLKEKKIYEEKKAAGIRLGLLEIFCFDDDDEVAEAAGIEAVFATEFELES